MNRAESGRNPIEMTESFKRNLIEALRSLDLGDEAVIPESSNLVVIRESDQDKINKSVIFPYEFEGKKYLICEA